MGTTALRAGLWLAAALLAACVWAAPPDLTQSLPGRVRGGYMSTGNLKLLPRMQETGMNVAIVKFGGVESPMREADAEALVAWSEACTAHDLAFLPVFNLYGGHEPAWVTDMAPYMDRAGVSYARTPCPANPDFWQQYVTPRFAGIAAALRDQHLAGICLDVEMYGADVIGYHMPCYCDRCSRRFLESRGNDGDLPEPAQRADSLARAGLEQTYWDFQAAEVERLAQACREALHEVAPATRIGVLHLDWESPFHHGMARGFGTPERPAVCLTERTYSSGYDDYVAAAQQRFRELGANVDLLCGIWHSKFPAEHVAEHYYHVAKSSWGYWVYTMQTFEAPDYSPLPQDHELYWQAIARANAELDRLAADPAYESALAIRPFEAPLMPLTTSGFQALDLRPYAAEAPAGEHPRFRRKNILRFYANAGDEIAFEITFRQVGKYRDVGQCLLADPAGRELVRGEIRPDQPAELRCRAEASGVYAVIADCGSNGWELTSASHPYAASAFAPVLPRHSPVVPLPRPLAATRGGAGGGGASWSGGEVGTDPRPTRADWPPTWRVLRPEKLATAGGVPAILREGSLSRRTVSQNTGIAILRGGA